MKRELLLVILFATMLTGCGLYRPTVVTHPDADLIISGTFGPWVKVAVFDFEQNTLVPAGWRYVGEFKGRTVSKYPWEEHIEANQKNNK